MQVVSVVKRLRRASPGRRMDLRPRAWAAALLLAFTLAGCVQKATPAASATETPPPATLSQSHTDAPAPAARNATTPAKAAALPPHEFRLDGCLNPRMLFFIDPATAQANLPPGYHAADATGLMRYLGFPQPPAVTTGRAVAGYDFLSCSGSSLDGGAPQRFSEVGVFIDPPNFGNRTPAVATNLDLYLLALHTTSPAWQAALAANGFPPADSLLARIDSGQSLVGPTLLQGHGAVAGEGVALASASWSGAANGNALSVHGRYWHSVDAGTFYLDFRLDETVYAGAIDACAHAAGSAYARASGTTSCGPEPRFAAIGVNSTIGGGIHWMPGVQPA